MLGAGASLGCSSSDAACLCKNPDFGFGLRDCATEACPNSSDANTVVAYGVTYCANGEKCLKCSSVHHD